MVEHARRDQLLAMKLAALIRGQVPMADPQPYTFPRGAAALDGHTGWVLLDERQESGLGPALAWAIRSGARCLNVLAESGTGTLARRAECFTLPIEVWHVDGRDLISAIAEPLPDQPPATDAHESLRALIVEGGATPTVEHGVLIGEVRGLEVCRVVTDPYTGATRLEVGIGQHDREAFQLMHGDVPLAAALAAVVASVAPHRQPGAAPHPLNRLGSERAFRARLIEEPGLVGASDVGTLPSPVPRPNLKDPQPCVARAVVDGRQETLVISTGVDLDVIPYATDARRSTGMPTRVVLPRRDALPVQSEIAALLRDPIPIVPVD